ncbi:MAG: hypothetical protein ACE5Z5_08960 [Candidatus Bathyarchaeia archaeon]
MAEEASIERRCWRYSSDRTPSMPVTEVVMMTLDRRISYPIGGGVARVEVDTGYDGSILIPDWVYYDILHLHLFETPEVGSLETPLGETQVLFSARAIIRIPLIETQTEVVMETFEGCRELLAGRDFINRYKILLDGPKNGACFDLS